MKLNYESEKYQVWTKADEITFERKLEFETAFDGMVKIYSLQTDNPKLNVNLTGKYFGNFIHYADNGVFLRMFKNKKSWPRTRLVFLDFVNHNLTIIKKINSSWNVWKGTDLGNGLHSIETKPDKKIEYQIKNVG
ncbi:hypothetical protein ACJD0Z_10670 [Flavobacteriaceae bacterium M23B6Z8]